MLLIFDRTKFTVTGVKVDKCILEEICLGVDLLAMLNALDEAFNIVVVAKTHPMELRLQ